MTSLLMFYTLPVACIGALCRGTGERVLAFVLYFLVTFFLVVTKFGFMATLLLGGAAMFASMFAILVGFVVSEATQRSRLAGALALSLSGSAVLWYFVMRYAH